MVYLITYDLNKPGQDYEGLYEAIKCLGPWWHYLDSTWLVDTSLNSAQAVWQELSSQIDEGDYLLIIKVTRDYYGWLANDAWDWIDKHVR